MRKFLMRFYSTHTNFLIFLLFNNNFSDFISFFPFMPSSTANKNNNWRKINWLSHSDMKGEQKIIAMKNTTKRKSEENWWKMRREIHTRKVIVIIFRCAILFWYIFKFKVKIMGFYARGSIKAASIKKRNREWKKRSFDIMYCFDIKKLRT